MNQNPLPRGLLQIVDRIAHGSDVVLELAKTAVAIEAKNATDLVGGMVVVHMFRIRRAADPTPTALSQDDPTNFLVGDPIALLQVVVPVPTVVSYLALPATLVMAW